MDPELKNTGPTLAIFRIRADMIQRCRNSLITSKSIIKNYKGTIIGLSCGQVKVVDGDWPSKTAVVLIEFPTMWDAVMSCEMTPIMKQQDWVQGCDINLFPMEKPWDDNLNTVLLGDFNVADSEKFKKEFVEPADKSITAYGAVADVLLTSSHRKVRGGWNPSCVALDQWASMRQVDSWFSSDDPEVKKIEAARIQSCSSNFGVIFDISPLKQ